MNSEKVNRNIVVMGSIEWFQGQAAEMNKFAQASGKIKAVQGSGSTIDNARPVLETEKYHCSLIQGPGPPDFKENLVKDTFQADCVILNVDHTHGSLEVDSSRNGQTYELAHLAFMPDIKGIVCCIDKLDATNPDCSKKKYNEIVKSISSCLKMSGYDLGNILFVPISGSEGDNLIERSPNFPWYKGPSLSGAIDQLPVPERPIDKPLRVIIESADPIGPKVTMIDGRVATGSLNRGTKVIVGPIGLKCEVISIDIDNQTVQEALAGDSVRCKLKNICPSDLKPGYVISDSQDDPAEKARSFRSEIIITSNYGGGVILKGHRAIIDFGSYSGTVEIKKFLYKKDPTSGRYERAGPELLQKGDAAIVEMVPQKPMVVEPFGEYAPLGRFVILENQRIVGVGFVRSVKTKKHHRTGRMSTFRGRAKLVGPPLIATLVNVLFALASN